MAYSWQSDIIRPDGENGTEVLDGQGVFQPQIEGGDNITIENGRINASGTLENVQADYTETDASAPSYIKHKPDLSIYATASGMETELAGKQDVIDDLSTIRSGAEAGSTAVQPGDLAAVATTGSYTSLSNTPQNIVQDADYVHTDNNFSNADKSKLDGIAAGAEVNVQADWNEADSSSDAYIANKPTIPAAQVNSDWNASSGVAAILNKPDLSAYATDTELTDGLATKQDVISDLDTIRAGAAAGATAAQPSDLPSSDELLPSASSGDAGKILSVDASGNPEWITPSGGTTYSAGDGIDIDANNVISADVDGTTIGIDASTKKIKSLQTIPTVDQHYSASSTNAQSGTAVAEALGSSSTLAAGNGVTLTESSGTLTVAADVDNVTIGFDSTTHKIKSLQTVPSVDQTYNSASTNAQSGTAVAQAIAAIPSSSYTAGDGIDITSNEISVDYDTNTLDVVGQTITENVTQQSSSGLFLLPSSVAALLSQQGDTQVTVHIPANTLKDENILLDDSRPATFKFTLYATNSPSETSVSLFSTPVEYTGFDGNNAEITEQDIVFNLPASVANQWSQNLSSAVAFNICIGRDGTTYTSLTLTVIGDLTTSPITFTFVDASATKLTVKNPVPASTSADEDKVLTVDSNGTPVWAASQGGGGTVDQTYNSSSTNAQSGTAVASALATVNQVPASTSSDEDKVLTVNSSGNPVWAEAAAPYSKPLVAGSNITITDGANDVTIAATVPTVDQVYSAVSANAQSGVAVASAISGINAVPASTSADQDKVLTVNSSGTPVWAEAQGGGGSGGDSEFPYDPGYMHTGWNKMVVRFGDASYDPTNKTSASAFTSIVALNEPGVYEYTFDLTTSRARVFQNEWNDFTNNPVDVLQLTPNDSYFNFGQLFYNCTGLRSVWNWRGQMGNDEQYFKGCSNLEIVDSKANERWVALTTEGSLSSSISDFGVQTKGASQLFTNCSKLRKVKTFIYVWNDSNGSAENACMDLRKLEVGPCIVGQCSLTSCYSGCFNMTRLYGVSDFPALTGILGNSSWGYPSYVFSMDSAFYQCRALIDLNGWNIGGAFNSITYAFYECGLAEIPLIRIAQTGTVNASNAFRKCKGLKTVPLLDYSKITNAPDMFKECESLTDVSPLTPLATSCTNVENLIANCKNVVNGVMELYTALSGSQTIASHDYTFSNVGSEAWNDVRSQIPSSWGGLGA